MTAGQCEFGESTSSSTSWRDTGGGTPPLQSRSPHGAKRNAGSRRGSRISLRVIRATAKDL